MTFEEARSFGAAGLKQDVFENMNAIGLTWGSFDFGNRRQEVPYHNSVNSVRRRLESMWDGTFESMLHGSKEAMEREGYLLLNESFPEETRALQVKLAAKLAERQGHVRLTVDEFMGLPGEEWKVQIRNAYIANRRLENSNRKLPFAPIFIAVKISIAGTTSAKFSLYDRDQDAEVNIKEEAFTILRVVNVHHLLGLVTGSGANRMAILSNGLAWRFTAFEPMVFYEAGLASGQIIDTRKDMSRFEKTSEGQDRWAKGIYRQMVDMHEANEDRPKRRLALCSCKKAADRDGDRDHRADDAVAQQAGGHAGFITAPQAQDVDKSMEKADKYRRELLNETRYLTMRFADNARHWQYVIWARQAACFSIAFAMEIMTYDSSGGSTSEQLVYACGGAAAVVLLIFFSQHKSTKPYCFPEQNVLEDILYVSDIILIILACIYTSLTRADSDNSAVRGVFEVIMLVLLLASLGGSIGYLIYDYKVVQRSLRVSPEFFTQAGAVCLSACRTH